MGSLSSLSGPPAPQVTPPSAQDAAAAPDNPSGLTSSGVPLGTDPLQTSDASFNAAIKNAQGAGAPTLGEAGELANSASTIAAAAGASNTEALNYGQTVGTYASQIGQPGGPTADQLKEVIDSGTPGALPDISADKQQQVANLVGVQVDQISQTNNQSNQFAVVDPSKGVAPLGNTTADPLVQNAISSIYSTAIPAGDNLNTYDASAGGVAGENGVTGQAGISNRAAGTAAINTSDLSGLNATSQTLTADGRAANELGNRDSDFLARPDGNPLSNYITHTQDELVSDAVSSAADPTRQAFSTSRLQDAALNFTNGQNTNYDYGATDLAVATSTGSGLLAAGSTTAQQMQSQGANAEQIGQNFLTGINGGSDATNGKVTYSDPAQFLNDVSAKAAAWGTTNPDLLKTAIPELASGELEKDGRNLVNAAYNAPYQNIDATNATYGTAQGSDAVKAGPSNGALATAARYLASNPDLLPSVSGGQTGQEANNTATLTNAINNYDTTGGPQGRQITFDPEAYLANTPDAAARVAAQGVQGDAQAIAASFDSLSNPSGAAT